MNKNKQDKNHSPTSNPETTSAVQPIKPLPKIGKPMRGNFDKKDKSNEEFPSAL
jgi:hypothetical protein